MRRLNDIEPVAIWSYFEEICAIPRTSRHEEKIRSYLLDFANKNNLASKVDEAGNVLITKAASPDTMNVKTVTLQSHMDMVGEKNADHPHNWLTDPIIPVVSGNWVSATGTTLGADDGIGIAAQMAILTDNELYSGEIECLFTVDEESGMTGAINLKPDFFKGRTLINLDSEDEGILYIGCAGGMDTVGTLKYKPVSIPDNSAAFELSVTGLRGGHSGDEIHKGFGNAVKIINRLIKRLKIECNISLCSLDAGNLRNAIPREAFAVIVTDTDNHGKIAEITRDFESALVLEYMSVENGIRINAEETELPEHALDEDSKEGLIRIIECCPHGVIAWSKEMEDLVQTSTNLASAKTTDDNTVIIVTTQRSSVASEKHEASQMVAKCMSDAGAEVKHSDGYPGWQPDMDSEILSVTRSSYRSLFGTEPLIRAIHAGLECGLIYEKVKGIDMISIGPTIRGAHTPEEKIDINSTRMFWKLLRDIIQKMPLTG